MARSFNLSSARISTTDARNVKRRENYVEEPSRKQTLNCKSALNCKVRQESGPCDITKLELLKASFKIAVRVGIAKVKAKFSSEVRNDLTLQAQNMHALTSVGIVLSNGIYRLLVM